MISPLFATLCLCWRIFERLNHSELRISVSAVNVTSRNLIYFDLDIEPIIPEHIMASAALPDGLPPIEFDGECY